MKIILVLLFSVLAYVIYGLYLSNLDLSVTGNQSEDIPPYFDYRGALNVRTDLSDGVLDFLSVVRAAQSAELDFLVTGEFYRENLKLPKGGYYNQLLVLSSTEYAYLNSRILVLGSDPLPVDQIGYKLSDWLSEPNTKNRKDFIAMLSPINAQGQLTWTSEWPIGLDAIEVLNPRVISERVYLAHRLSAAWSFLIYPFNPQYAFLRLFEEPSAELELWDRLNQKKSIHGFAGLDLSGRAIIFPNTYFEFPSYQTMFWLLSTHVLTRQELVGDFDRDFPIFLKALKSGNIYFALEMLGNPKGFTLYVQDGEQRHLMGDSFPYRSGQKIIYALPENVREIAEINIFRHGQKIAQLFDKKGEFSLPSPGVYRVTIRIPSIFPFPDQKKWVTWIFTNPFYAK
ncbi:MAG: hypothetical protein NZ480_02740 [Bdellovibrionaceae bacterium]|nr:hypothetical protein [Pseudobdellovibrionaceae bacterium]MDW8189439.1 hypothetical protein [Pseudobdellovibrionaceae bacterium]